MKLFSFGEILDGMLLAEIDFMGISPTLTAVLACLWFFMLGGCIGSFMNVVIYRVPAGLSIVHPPSRCPKCENPIRAYDNIPMLGWLMLRGKCRDCKTPISARYPLVEALVAFVFVAIAWVEPLNGGENLPYTFPRVDGQPSMLWVLYGAQMTVMCTLICAALIQYDGHKVAPGLFVVALVVSIMALLYWSQYRTLHLSVGEQPLGWPDGLQHGLVSIGAGAGIGLLASLSSRHGERLSYALAAACIAVLLRWQAVSAICVASSLGFLLSTLVGRSNLVSRISWFAWATIATGLYIALWRAIADRFDWLSTNAGWKTFIFAAAIVLVASLAGLRVLKPQCSSGSLH